MCGITPTIHHLKPSQKDDDTLVTVTFPKTVPDSIKSGKFRNWLAILKHPNFPKSRFGAILTRQWVLTTETALHDSKEQIGKHSSAILSLCLSFIKPTFLNRHFVFNYFSKSYSTAILISVLFRL